MAIRIVARREPPGDRWLLDEDILSGGEAVILTSLTNCLNEVFKLTGDKIYTVDAAKGIVSTDDARDRGPQVWDLYGEKGPNRELIFDAAGTDFKEQALKHNDLMG
jgi:hypothetical protein